MPTEINTIFLFQSLLTGLNVTYCSMSVLRLCWLQRAKATASSKIFISKIHQDALRFTLISSQFKKLLINIW